MSGNISLEKPGRRESTETCKLNDVFVVHFSYNEILGFEKPCYFQISFSPTCFRMNLCSVCYNDVPFQGSEKDSCISFEVKYFLLY